MTLYKKIKKEILEDTYLSSRIDTNVIEKLLNDCYCMDELHNTNDRDYFPLIFLAFNSPDIADFFLFSRFESIEEYEEYAFEKVELNDLSIDFAKRIFWTEYAITIILYLELDFRIAMEYKIALTKILKKIIELYSTYEELTGTLKEIGKAYTYFFQKYILGKDDEQEQRSDPR